MTDIQTLYDDPSCLVVSKPANVVVDELQFLGHPVHRLDKGTTGCLLIAKTQEAHAALQNQFKERTVEKMYLTIVSGVPGESVAMIDSPIGRSLLHRTKMSLFRTGKTRGARTAYAVISRGSRAALLRCEPQTGRTHQIRVHLAAIGHPILGDETYGTAESKRLSDEIGIASPLLHAWKLQFESPATRERVSVEAPVPEGFMTITGRMKFVIPDS